MVTPRTIPLREPRFRPGGFFLCLALMLFKLDLSNQMMRNLSRHEQGEEEVESPTELWSLR